MSIACTGAKLIKYTTDGTDPRFSQSALVWSAATEVDEGAVVRAVAFANNKFTSAIAEKTVTTGG